MNQNIKEAYDKWHGATMYKSSCLHSGEPTWDEFIECCKKEPEADVLDFFYELLEKPTHAVFALDTLYPGTMKYDGYVSLQDACNAWRVCLHYMKENKK